MSVILRNPADFSVLELDASLKETEAGDAEVTKHPVEQGADVADNVRAKPRTLRLEGVFVNEPLEEHLLIPPAPAGEARATDLYRRLDAWRLQGAALSVLTERSKYKYAPFVITHLDWPNDVKAGDTVNFSVALEEIIVVETRRVAVRARALVKGGEKGAVPVQPPPAEMASALKQIEISANQGKGIGQSLLDGSRVMFNGHRELP